jgi:hypothetical protein
MPKDEAAKGSERPRRKSGRPVGETLGGILAGFDQQVLRQQPPAQELVLKGSPVRGLSGDDPGDLQIVLPEPSAEEPNEAGEEGGSG